MIGNMKWRVSCFVQLVMVAIFFFPWCSLSAQEFEAVQRRLSESVELGELSIDQAKLMMDALRRSSDDADAAKKKKALAEKLKGKKEDGDAKFEDEFVLVFTLGKNTVKRERRYIIKDRRALPQIFDRECRRATKRWEDEMAIGDKLGKAVEAKKEAERLIQSQGSAPKKTGK